MISRIRPKLTYITTPSSGPIVCAYDPASKNG
jgi:hypothetical protein